MKRILFLVLCTFIFISCKETVFDDGKAGISHAEMAAILTDLHIAEAYSNVLREDTGNRAGQKNIDSLAVYYKEVLQHHNVTLKDFEESMTYYREHPAQLDSVYSIVVTELGQNEKVMQE